MYNLENVIHQIGEMNGCLFQHFNRGLRQNLSWFLSNTRKRFFLEALLKNGTRIFKIAFSLRDRHVFLRESLDVLNFFYTLTLKQFFFKRKPFSKNWSKVF